MGPAEAPRLPLAPSRRSLSSHRSPDSLRRPVGWRDAAGHRALGVGPLGDDGQPKRNANERDGAACCRTTSRRARRTGPDHRGGRPGGGRWEPEGGSDEGIQHEGPHSVDDRPGVAHADGHRRVAGVGLVHGPGRRDAGAGRHRDGARQGRTGLPAQGRGLRTESADGSRRRHAAGPLQRAADLHGDLRGGWDGHFRHARGLFWAARAPHHPIDSRPAAVLRRVRHQSQEATGAP